MARLGRGRSGERERFWRRVVERQRHSGLSIRRFCRGAGLTETAFYFWRRELPRRDVLRRSSPRAVLKRPLGTPRQTRPRFVSVQVATPAESQPRLLFADTPTLEIVLTDGTLVRVGRGVDRQTLTDVMAVLTSADDGAAEGQPC